MYTLQLGDDCSQVFYQCIFCRNAQNWEDRVSELAEKEEERQELEREGLLHQKAYLRQLLELGCPDGFLALILLQGKHDVYRKATC